MNKFKRWLIHRLGGVDIEDMAGLRSAFESQMTKGRIVTLTAKMNLVGSKAYWGSADDDRVRRGLARQLGEALLPFITYNTSEDGVAITASIEVLRKGENDNEHKTPLEGKVISSGKK